MCKKKVKNWDWNYTWTLGAWMCDEWRKESKKAWKSSRIFELQTWWRMICRHGNGIWWHPIIRLDALMATSLPNLWSFGPFGTFSLKLWENRVSWRALCCHGNGIWRNPIIDIELLRAEPVIYKRSLGDDRTVSIGLTAPSCFMASGLSPWNTVFS